jgi:hypothetical protein
MNHHQCLNCGKHLGGKYCQHCGQKATTHRFTLTHVFSHDVIHGVLHVDKGILYTLKQLMTRPGYAVREFISGKRANHFNYVTLLLLLIATELFIMVTGGITTERILPDKVRADDSVVELFSRVWQFAMKYMKEISVVSILAYSTASFLVFRKAGQNFAEHMVMNCYRECGVIVINILFLSSLLIPMDGKAKAMVSMAAMLVMYAYNYNFYLQYFKQDYSNRFYVIFLVMWSQTLMALLICCVIAAIFATMVAMGIVELQIKDGGDFIVNYHSRA